MKNKKTLVEEVLFMENKFVTKNKFLTNTLVIKDSIIKECDFTVDTKLYMVGCNIYNTNYKENEKLKEVIEKLKKENKKLKEEAIFY